MVSTLFANFPINYFIESFIYSSADMKWLMEQNLALNGIFIFMGNNTALPASASSLILSFVVCSLLTGTLGKVEAKSVHCNILLL